MKYCNADNIFPKHLLKEIQTYFHGGLVYIPSQSAERKKWGEHSGSRQALMERNRQIKHQFSAGVSIDELANSFYLAPNSIKKIVYTRDHE